jgi:hypothetical protein
MAAFRTFPILESDLSEVSTFLGRSMNAMVAATRVDAIAGEQAARSSTWQDDLLWLVDNPARREDILLGEILRSEDGTLAGMILTIPWVYRLGDRRLLGLAAGNFFVDAEARMQGFFLFRRYLAARGVDFWYASSCNQQSGLLWAKSGGVQVENSDLEYLFIYQMGPLLEEAALRRRVPRRLAGSLRWAGPLAGLAAAPRRPKTSLSSETCEDWDRLEALAERCRDPERLTCDRSAAYLRWKYGRATEAGPGSGPEVHRFSDGLGHEGWFSLGYSTRGQFEQIRGASLLDAVWPTGHVDFSEVLAKIIEVAASKADVLSIRDRSAFGLRDGYSGLRLRKLPAPEAFLIAPAPKAVELARIADFAAADRV